MIRGLKVALLVFALSSGAALAGAPTFVFTAIPDQDENRLVERFSRFAHYLEGRLGTPVKYAPVKTYPAAVTAFTNSDVQLAWFGGFTGFQARRAVPARGDRLGPRGREFQVVPYRTCTSWPEAFQTIPGGHCRQDFHAPRPQTASCRNITLERIWAKVPYIGLYRNPV